MPFGFVTQRQLDQHREELRRDLRSAEEDQRRAYEKLELEWSEWFDKFRRLYARLSKRVRDAADERPVEAGPGTTGEPSGGAPESRELPPVSAAALRRRMRGF